MLLEYSQRSIGQARSETASGRMRPNEFIKIVDDWVAAGGEFPRIAPHDVTTVAEAQAVCRAAASRHIYDAGQFGSLALSELLNWFQAVENPQATWYLRDHGLPILRQILLRALNQEHAQDPQNANEFGKAHLFVVKILGAYQQRGDAPLIVRAARDPSLSDGYLWPVIFDMIAERHPAAAEICEQLSEPLPSGR
jgi:hypothetical protein